MKRILVAVDLFGPLLHVVDLAADLAAKFDAKLMILTVSHEIAGPDPVIEAYARMEHNPEPVSIIAIGSMLGDLARVRDRAVARGARQVSTEVLIG